MSFRVTLTVDVEAWNATEATALVVDVLSAEIQIATPVLVGVEENDPTPFCSKCLAKTATACDCGPILPDD